MATTVSLLRLANENSLASIFPGIPTDSLSRITDEANMAETLVEKIESEAEKLGAKLGFYAEVINTATNDDKDLDANKPPIILTDASTTDVDVKTDTPPSPALDEAVQDHHTFDSGAQRSEIKPAYHLIPAEALTRLAARFALGAEKYGILNLYQGMNDPAFVRQAIDHMHDHLLAFQVNGCMDDDNLAAIMWGAAFLCVVEHHNPNLLKDAIFEPRAKAIADAVKSDRPEQNLFTGTKNQSKT